MAASHTFKSILWWTFFFFFARSTLIKGHHQKLAEDDIANIQMICFRVLQNIVQKGQTWCTSIQSILNIHFWVKTWAHFWEIGKKAKSISDGKVTCTENQKISSHFVKQLVATKQRWKCFDCYCKCKSTTKKYPFNYFDKTFDEYING